MNKELIEKYKNELMRVYRSAHGEPAKPAAAQAPAERMPDTFSGQQGAYDPGQPYVPEDSTDENGRLTVMVTTVSGIYPVEDAKVTVFTGDYENQDIKDTDVTNQSGKTKTFELYAPSRSLSMQSGATELPYALYNILVEADGFASNLHLNVPVFKGVTSMQRSNLTPLTILGGSSGPIVYNELSKYPL